MKMDYIDSYYTRRLATQTEYPAPTEDIEVETCIIGGGLAGLNTALELALRGHSTAVVEANRIAWGASGRNGGFVIPVYALGAKELVKKVGLDHTIRLQTLINDALKTIKERIGHYDIDCDQGCDGMLKLSLADDRQGLRDDYTFYKETLGLNVDYWDRDAVRAAISSTAYNDGILYKDAFQFHSLNYARGVAAAAAGHGARIFEQSRVIKTEENLPQKTVFLANGRKIIAKNIVYACSGYIGTLSGRLSRAIVPVATYVMNTEPLGDRLKDVIRVPYCILDNRFANDYYRPLADTRLLWGGRVSVFEPEPEKLAQMLRHDMLKVFPQLSDVNVEVAWGGFMGYSRHKMPQIGEMSPGVWYCTGFGGYGMAATTVGGAVMAGAITGTDQNWTLFAPFGLKFTGGQVIAPAIAQTMYWGYQLADKLRHLLRR